MSLSRIARIRFQSVCDLLEVRCFFIFARLSHRDDPDDVIALRMDNHDYLLAEQPEGDVPNFVLEAVVPDRRLAQTPAFGSLRFRRNFLFRPLLLGSIPLRAMLLYRRFYGPGELPFLTASTYPRIPVFRSERFRRCFVQKLEEDAMFSPSRNSKRSWTICTTTRWCADWSAHPPTGHGQAGGSIIWRTRPSCAGWRRLLPLGVCVSRSDFPLPVPHRGEYTPLRGALLSWYLQPGEMQSIPARTYRRAPLFLSDRFRSCFVQRLKEAPFNVFSEKMRNWITGTAISSSVANEFSRGVAVV